MHGAHADSTFLLSPSHTGRNAECENHLHHCRQNHLYITATDRLYYHYCHYYFILSRLAVGLYCAMKQH